LQILADIGEEMGCDVNAPPTNSNFIVPLFKTFLKPLLLTLYPGPESEQKKSL
jgi:hypothetical protein